MQLVQQFFDDGHGVLGDVRERVKVPIVDAESPRPVFLVHQDDRLCERVVAFLDDALAQQFFDLSFDFILVVGLVTIGSDVDRLGP